jgi:hypothetical protein
LSGSDNPASETTKGDSTIAHPERLNYFNYFTEVEDEFVRRRGKQLLISPMDWALVESWKNAGIPLHIVLRAINELSMPMINGDKNTAKLIQFFIANSR